MLDTTLTEDTSPEEMIEFENPFEGEVFLIKAEDMKEWELQLELSRLRQVAQHLHAPSHLARVAEDPEGWAKFASLIIGRANTQASCKAIQCFENINLTDRFWPI